MIPNVLFSLFYNQCKDVMGFILKEDSPESIVFVFMVLYDMKRIWKEKYNFYYKSIIPRCNMGIKVSIEKLLYIFGLGS